MIGKKTPSTRIENPRVGSSILSLGTAEAVKQGDFQAGSRPDSAEEVVSQVNSRSVSWCRVCGSYYTPYESDRLGMLCCPDCDAKDRFAHRVEPRCLDCGRSAGDCEVSS